jgi:hypothetical protein
MIFTRAMIDGRNCLDGVEHQAVDPADDGGLVVDVEDVHQLLGLAHLVLVVLVAELAPLVVLGPVDVVDGVQDLLRRHQHREHLVAQLRPDVVQGSQVQRVGGGHHHRVALAFHRQGPVLLGEPDGDAGGQIAVDLVEAQVGREADAQLLAQRAQHSLLGDGAHLHQHLADAPALLLLGDQRLLQHLGREPFAEDEDLAQATLRHR